MLLLLTHILQVGCQEVWGIGGYILFYGLYNCMDSIRHKRIKFLRSLANPLPFFSFLMDNHPEIYSIQQIAVILQQETQNLQNQNLHSLLSSRSHLKGGYVNFGFAVLDFMLQDHCNLL